MRESVRRLIPHLSCGVIMLAVAASLWISASLSPSSSATGQTSQSVATAAIISGPARVIDGDTIDVAGERVRLEGIDAPEADQHCPLARSNDTWRCGRSATRRLTQLVTEREVTCQLLKRDGYGRWIGLCRAGNEDLNARMIESGLAWAFVKYSSRYVHEEAAVRRQKIGVWQVSNALPPWEFRRTRWAQVENSAPHGCAIKGNISRGGRIYHMPWSTWYGRTRIDEERGERWFCSESEAQAAGFRPARSG